MVSPTGWPGLRDDACPSGLAPLAGWLAAVFIGIRDAVLGPGAGVRAPFWWELLWIGFHFDTVLYSDLDTWGRGLCMRRPGALTR